MLLPERLSHPDVVINKQLNNLRDSINLINAYGGTSIEMDTDILQAQFLSDVAVALGMRVSTIYITRINNRHVLLIDWSHLVGKAALSDYVSRYEEQTVQRSIPKGNDWGNTSRSA